MSNDVDQQVNVSNSISSSLLQSSSQTCTSTCSQQQDGNVAIVAGRTGNIVYGQKCTSNAACTMSITLQSSINNMLANAVQQSNTAITDLFNDGIIFSRVNEGVDIKSNIVNNMTQITQASCQASSVQSQSDNFLYVQSGGRTGNVNYAQDGNASANCTMINASKMQAKSQINNNAAQKAKQIGMFAMIFVAIVLCVLIGGIVILLTATTGVFKGIVGGGGSGKEPTDPTINQGALPDPSTGEGGLTPDDVVEDALEKAEAGAGEEAKPASDSGLEAGFGEGGSE